MRVIFITTDPARDTASVLRAWLDHFGSAFIGLRGSPAQIHQAEAALALPASEAQGSSRDYHMTHASSLLAFGADDSLRVIYDAGVTAAALAADIPRLAAVGRSAR